MGAMLMACSGDDKDSGDSGPAGDDDDSSAGDDDDSTDSGMGAASYEGNTDVWGWYEVKGIQAEKADALSVK